MKTFRARFVVYARKADADGFLYWLDVGSLASPGEVAALLAGSFAELSGGFVLLFNNRVWNSPKHVKFDPRHVWCEIDSVSYALAMVQDIALNLTEPGEHTISSAEMLSVRLAHGAPGHITIEGLTYRGEPRFPVETVRLARFARQMRAATNDFVRVARGEMERRLKALTPDQRSSVEEANRTLIGRFEQAAECLRTIERSGAVRAESGDDAP